MIRLRDPSALQAATPLPAWVEAALRQSPWVVVRRDHAREGSIPVGARGATRSQRFAAFAPIVEIADRISPEDLVGSRHLIDPSREHTVPALNALSRVAPILARRGRRWGPGGSVGYEIATGLPATTPASDLDVILRQDDALATNDAIDLLAALVEAASPARIDVMLETPRGGVSLADLAARPARVLLRTPEGARLCEDPWTAAAGGMET
ncbi:Phosphoribosyl-dephospho-CoA transferase [Minicystis rosea]|nr:Phosphoribosyl-dephospho-CoA transferase [Minicystis rosea]